MLHKRPSIVNALPFLLGAAVVSTFATLQNILITGIAFHPRNYLIPILVGGMSGFIIGRAYFKQLATVEKLQEQSEELQEQSEELQATEEMLRSQINEYIETHDHLLATEEMLRRQIEEFTINQKLLKDSNNSLQTLFDVSPLAIAVTSYPNGTLREINQKFAKDFGYSHDEVVGKTCIDLGLWVDPEERESFRQLMHEQQSIVGFPIDLNTSLGEKRNVLLYRTLMEFKGEQCTLMVFLDITEQRRMEEQLRQTQKMDVVGQLAGGIAHDFNNMLTGIMGSAELLRNFVKDDPGPMKLVNTIFTAATRSADLTRQLLVFSRKGKNASAYVSINDTIGAVISLLERSIDKKITLTTRFTATNPVVKGDQTLLQNALLNLGVNARDAMPEGGTLTFATANVVLDSSSCDAQHYQVTPGSYLEITVSDTGVGMTKDLVEHIFEPFFTTKEVGKGTGLGLSTVYGTAKEHHGWINVFSEPGTGTAFKIYLPSSSGKESQPSLEGEEFKGSGSILLVDDESIIRDLGQTLLEEVGYTVYLAENGQEALEVYAREIDTISLVILDMVMPKMNGKETLLQLQKLNPTVKVLISSGFHQEKVEDLLNEHGAKGFIQKPYRRLELCKAVAEAIINTDEMPFLQP